MTVTLPAIRLPRHWPKSVKSALVCAVAFAQAAVIESRSWCANSPIARIRLVSENERLKAEITLVREELRIKDVRLARIAAANRPHYPPTERLAILALKVARGWSAAQAAKVFLLADATIAHWLKRIDEQEQGALVKLPEPVNRFPDLVRQVVRQLKCLCPIMGKVRMAQMPARAGLHLSPSTVRRILNKPVGSPTGRPPRKVAEAPPSIASSALSPSPARHVGPRVVTAKYSHHVWHVDLTVVPTSLGFWIPWVPFALAQCWPFCFWVAAVLDHFSRRALIHGVYTLRSTSSPTRVRSFARNIAIGASRVESSLDLEPLDSTARLRLSSDSFCRSRMSVREKSSCRCGSTNFRRC